MQEYWQLRKTLQEAKRGNWVKPSDASIRKEYQIEYLKHLIHELPRNIFPTEAEFVKAVKAAPAVEINNSVDRKIYNRSRTQNMEDLLDLIAGYRSFPKFRNEDTLKALEKLIKAGKPVDMPIVVKFPKGDMRVLAGNTRMDIAFMNGINPTVLMLDLTPYLKLTEAASSETEPTICELLSQPNEKEFVGWVNSVYKKNSKYKFSSSDSELLKYTRAVFDYFDTAGEDKYGADALIVKMAKCPNRASWTYSFDKKVWRGLLKSAYYLQKNFRFTGEVVEIQGRKYLVCVGNYKSRYPAQSWSYGFGVADSFSSIGVAGDSSDVVSIILEYNIKRQETFLMPDVIRQVSSHPDEQEILRISNTPITVRGYVNLPSLWGELTHTQLGHATTDDIKKFQQKLIKVAGEDAAKKIMTQPVWKEFEKIARSQYTV
jgi:hypothetical protein